MVMLENEHWTSFKTHYSKKKFMTNIIFIKKGPHYIYLGTARSTT